MSKLKKFQLKTVNIILIILIGLLFYNFLNSEGIEHYFVTAATLIMLIHIWWGAIFYIKHVKHTNNLLELPIDMSIIFLLLASVFLLDQIVKWLIIFGTFFVIVIVKYLIGLSKTKNKKVKEYIKEKIRIESPGVILFYFGAMVGTLFDYWWIPRFLSISVFLVQMPFIYLIVFKKRIYSIPFD